ncbi:hypothetical protein RhiLY_01856 [Ceratobasidium sp. AG-Ba]|nr:hypothetical protein RhiLY_01856 [Ceratobasidium sp. AG-Ba]
MEKRRQELNLADSGHLKPLGRKKETATRSATSGIGEDLGATNFRLTTTAARPKLAPNPRRKPKQDDSGESEIDPIDFLSPQEPAATTSTSSARSVSRSSNRPTPQPPPFSKGKPAGTASNTQVDSTTVHTLATVAPLNSSNKLVNSIDTLSAQPASRSKARTTVLLPDASVSSKSSLEHGGPQTRPARQPAPAPFARLGPRRARVEESNSYHPAASPDPKPAPPPFKRAGSAVPKPKRVASQSLLDDRERTSAQLSATNDFVSEPVPLHKLPRIPKKGQVLTSTLPQLRGLPAPPKRVPAEFPMAAYAREAAVKMAAMAVDPPSPRKRFRPEDIEHLLRSPTALENSMSVGEDTLYDMDPEDLCPFCDEPLPDDPSPDLLKTLSELRLLAKPEPRARNPLGLTAPLTAFINLCHMHRAESTYVQEGIANRWPTVIDWNDVRKRLQSEEIMDALQEIISDPPSSEFFVTLSDTVKRQGVLKAASIKVQLDNFELSHPGYYGEQGTLVFFDVLTHLFPDLSPEECRPLQPREFFLSVLVPEAAVLLIEQDMCCTHEEALKILRESRQYGQMMFPDRGDHLGMDGHMGEENAKQLQWRKDMIQVGSTPTFGIDAELARKPEKAKLSPFRRNSDDEIVVLDE